jgi:DNA-binding MarR family transcriptional regulator
MIPLLLNIAIKSKAYKDLELRHNLQPSEIDYLLLVDCLSLGGIKPVKLVFMRNTGIYRDVTMFKANAALEGKGYLQRLKRIKKEPYLLHITPAGHALIKDVERTVKREAKKLLKSV